MSRFNSRTSRLRRFASRPCWDIAVGSSKKRIHSYLIEFSALVTILVQRGVWDNCVGAYQAVDCGRTNGVDQMNRDMDQQEDEDEG